MNSPRPALGTAWLLVACLSFGCSRPSSEQGSRPERAGSATASGPRAAAAAAEATTDGGPIPTPEDVEAETEQRITEHNLEQELDRLEREIQAE